MAAREALRSAFSTLAIEENRPSLEFVILVKDFLGVRPLETGAGKTDRPCDTLAKGDDSDDGVVVRSGVRDAGVETRLGIGVNGTNTR